MIDTGHLQIIKDQEEINQSYLESVQEIENIISPVKIAEMRRNQEMELGIFTESSDEAYMEGVTEAITKLGNKIIEIVNRIVEFIKSIPEKIKEATWNKADVSKKMEMIKKEDPTKYDTLKVYIDKGLLDFNTFDSMKKFYDGYDELLSDLKKKEVNEKSLKGKLEKMKSSVNNNSDTIKNVSAIVGIAGAGVLLACNFTKFMNEFDKWCENQTEKFADRAQRSSRNAEIMAKVIQTDKELENCSTKASVIAQATAEVEKMTKMNVSKITSLRASLWKKFDKLASTVLKDKDPVNTTKIGLEYSKEANRLKGVASYNRSNYNSKVSRQKSHS